MLRSLLATVLFCGFLTHSFAGGAEPFPQTVPVQGGYVGSEACARCHLETYRSWRSTRHSYSVLTGEEARAAGFPMLGSWKGARATSIQSWDDVSYTIGGRQRITYVDEEGRVQDTSYHHRIGKWDGFPSKQLADCVSCHYTGPSSAEEPASPGPAGSGLELNIGCESCHGPGGRHEQTLAKGDIVVDPSSRVCGKCHTAAGRVLPADDMHETHDLVQVWNRDSHSTGLRFNSQNAFCARCHSPYQGSFLETRQNAARRSIFTEQNQNITCIGCHNPHGLTNPYYLRSRVSLDPPLAPNLHIYKGDDSDFMTSDFNELRTTEEVCVHCHRGPDRVDLDHANATCNDCHNSFKRNRSLATRAFQDANHGDLSCRPCHQNADHLISILYRDPDFLQPSHIHNLRTLPATVGRKHGFRYSGLGQTSTFPGPAAPTDSSGGYQAEEPPSPQPQQAEASPDAAGPWEHRRRARDEVLRLLATATHAGLVGSEEVRTLQSAVVKQPGRPVPYLDLALAYLGGQHWTAAREVLESAMGNDSPMIVARLPGNSSLDNSRRRIVQKLGAVMSASEPLFGEPGGEAIRLWLQGCLELASAQFDQAVDSFRGALEADPENANLVFYSGLGQLFSQRREAAIEDLDKALEIQPTHLASQVTLSLTHLQQRQRLPQALEILEKAIAENGRDPITHYVLGIVRLRLNKTVEAAQALRVCVTVYPQFRPAWFELARAHRLGGSHDEAVKAYRELIQLRSSEFEPHYRLGTLLKFLSDRSAFRFLDESERTPASGLSDSEWQKHLLELKRESADYGEAALAELELAIGIQPWNVDATKQLGETYRRLERLPKAMEYFQRLVDRNPIEWIYHYRLGTVSIQMGQYESARQSLQRALELSPTSGDVYLALALAYLRMDRVDDAINTLEQGRIYEPFNPALYTNLGAAYARRGDYELARDALEKSLTLTNFPVPRLHLAYTNLAILHLREGRDAEAVKVLKNALHVFPGYQHARDLLDRISSQPTQGLRGAEGVFVFNDRLEIFGEVTTVGFNND